MNEISTLKSFLKQFPFVYPSKIILSCKKWIDKDNAAGGMYRGGRGHSYVLIEPPESHIHQLPSQIDESSKNMFSQNVFYHTSNAYLFNLKDSYLYRQMGLILTNRNALFQEFTHHFNISSISKAIFKRPFLTFSNRVKNINGTGAVLLSPQSHNYYHWLFDVLPRIKLYESVLSHIDYFCVSAEVPQKFIDILPEFGIRPDKILLITDTEKFHFDNLYVASLAGSEGRSPEWAINYVRKKLIPVSSAIPHKKLYFRRGKITGRKILNEDEVIRTLVQLGFEIVDTSDLTINQQLQLMQQAKLIVGAHGAALSNLLFAQKGIALVEIFSPDYFRTDCYFTLARILKCNYKYLVGVKPANANWGDIIVDQSDLMSIINSIPLD